MLLIGFCTFVGFILGWLSAYLFHSFSVEGFDSKFWRGC